MVHNAALVSCCHPIYNSMNELGFAVGRPLYELAQSIAAFVSAIFSEIAAFVQGCFYAPASFPPISPARELAPSVQAAPIAAAQASPLPEAPPPAPVAEPVFSLPAAPPPAPAEERARSTSAPEPAEPVVAVASSEGPILGSGAVRLPGGSSAAVPDDTLQTQECAAFLYEVIAELRNTSPEINLVDKMRTPVMARAFLARRIVYTIVMDYSPYTNPLPAFFERKNSAPLSSENDPEALSTQLTQLRRLFLQGSEEKQNSLRNSFRAGTPPAVVNKFLIMANIIVTGITDNPLFIESVESLRREYKVPGIVRASSSVEQVSQADLRNAFAFFYGVAQRLNGGQWPNEFHRKMDDPREALELFARLTVHDLVMRVSEPIAPPPVFLTRISDGPSDFYQQAALLKAEYDNLSAAERDMVRISYTENIATPRNSTRSAVKVLERVRALQQAVFTQNPPFAASAKLIREKYLAASTRRGKACLRSLLNRLISGELKYFRYTIKSPESAREFYSRLTVYDIVMKERASLSQLLERPPDFFLIKMPNSSSNFIRELSELHRDYEKLPENVRATAPDYFLTDKTARLPELNAFLTRARTLERLLKTHNPSFAASVEAMREENLALAEPLTHG